MKVGDDWEFSESSSFLSIIISTLYASSEGVRKTVNNLVTFALILVDIEREDSTYMIA